MSASALINLFAESNPCCRARTAECMSCIAGQSEQEYCRDNPRTLGCPGNFKFTLEPLLFKARCKHFILFGDSH